MFIRCIGICWARALRTASRTAANGYAEIRSRRDPTTIWYENQDYAIWDIATTPSAAATVDVTIWDDRIEIHSPGPLPGHITLDNIRDEHYSRNRRVMGVLKRLGLVEEYGEGIDRMFREMEARLMDPPTILAGPAPSP